MPTRAGGALPRSCWTNFQGDWTKTQLTNPPFGFSPAVLPRTQRLVFLAPKHMIWRQIWARKRVGAKTWRGLWASLPTGELAHQTPPPLEPHHHTPTHSPPTPRPPPAAAQRWPHAKHTDEAVSDPATQARQRYRGTGSKAGRIRLHHGQQKQVQVAGARGERRDERGERRGERRGEEREEGGERRSRTIDV